MIQYSTYTTRPPVPQKRGKKRYVALLAILLILVPSGLYVYAALYKNPPTVSAAVPLLAEAPPAQPMIDWPAQGQAAIGSVDDGVLAASSTNEQVKPIASMAKVVTALAVMKKKPFEAKATGETLTLDDQDVAYYNEYVAKNGSVAKVTVGETLSQYQAMEAMLLPSANNMASTLARWGFGSLDEYVAYANAMLKDMGLTKTVITDASGFMPTTVGTPSEMVVIGQKALTDPVIAKIVAEQQADVPVAGIVNNTNRLLTDSSVVGIKTGTTDQAGACLLFAAKHAIDSTHDVTVIGVIMGATNTATLFSSSKSLLASAEKGFGAITIRPAGAVIASAQAPWGTKSGVVTKDALTVYGWKGTNLQTVPTISELTVPKAAGDKVGTLTITDYPGASVDLILSDPLTAPTTLWRLKNYF